MKLSVPPGHRVGMLVPEGGSCCAKCKFYDRDGSTPNGRCGSEYFIKWQKSEGAQEPDNIPEPPNEYCCDFYDWEE